MKKVNLVFNIGLLSILTALISFVLIIVMELNRKTFMNLESRQFIELFSKTSPVSHLLITLCGLALTVSILAYLYLYLKAPRETIA